MYFELFLLYNRNQIGKNTVEYVIITDRLVINLRSSISAKIIDKMD